MATVLDRTGDADLDGASPIQLLEDIEYRYELDCAVGRVVLEPQEVFDPDDDSRLTGRLRPKRRTGTMPIQVLGASHETIGTCEVEVRSRKLNYLDEYRWMLGRIADEATESLMQRFGASEARFRLDRRGTPETMYQRFALLKALLNSDTLDGALGLITNRPHLEYQTEIERTHPARGVRSSRQTVRALTGPGPRTRGRVRSLSTVPIEIDRRIHVETLDTVPNRFVKHALERWLSLVIDTRNVLRESGTVADQRGLREAVALEVWLTSYLNSPTLRDVGLLASFPAGNQVLQRREGYRDVFRAYLMMEVAAQLDWQGGEDIFSAGQRDVATLYEYWVFLELASVVGDIAGATLDVASLFSVGDGGLSLDLRRGATAVVRGSVLRRGRRLDLELYFNKQFSRGREASWTTSVRPDCSLLISPADDPAGTTWLHFDAKYRLHELKQVLMGSISGTDDEAAGTGGSTTVKNDDLLKMHAYRDAVRRTAGAYVLYPGSDDEPAKGFRKYHEVLPGLGAFVLRPTPGGHGASAGVGALSGFIGDVLDHVAAQGTSRERHSYWERKSYQAWAKSPRVLERRLDPVDFLEAPAEDTLVLLGFVRSEAHRSWVHDHGLYVLRADEDRRGSISIDSAELGASLLVLYNPVWEEAELLQLDGSLYIRSAHELTDLGYPDPGGRTYLCLGVAHAVTGSLHGPSVSMAARRGRDEALWAAPMALTWADLQAALEGGD